MWTYQLKTRWVMTISWIFIYLFWVATIVVSCQKCNYSGFDAKKSSVHPFDRYQRRMVLNRSASQRLRLITTPHHGSNLKLRINFL